MKSNSIVRFQSRLFALFVMACLLFQAGFIATPALASSQPAPLRISFSCANVVSIPASECAALVALYNSTNGPGWSVWYGNPWLQSNNPCIWDLVTCSGGHVTQLNLYSHNLFGTLPTELGNLTYLTLLNLNGNGNLSGSIPASLGSLTNLTVLDLSSSQLSGSIPASLGSLTNLTQLYLSNNQLSGSIPTELGNLTNLQYLYLSSNQLSGSIPASLGSLTNLNYLYLNNNQLSGSIPTSLGSLTNLVYLNLSNNQLSGSIPTELGSLTNLQNLYLLNNKLSGAFPTSFAAPNLPNLTTFTFDCWLTSSDAGVIAFIANFAGAGWQLNTCATFTSCAAVSEISATECNALTALYTSTNGASWQNHYNWLSVDHPCFWYGVSCSGGHVTQLNLQNNALHGALPAALGSLTYLEYLNLSNNNFTGGIPPELGSLAQLRTLNLGNAGLSGAIPAQLGSLAQLRFLYLYDNNLTGSIPTELGSLSNLLVLDLSYNYLSGSLPASLGNLAQLRYLYLYFNQLTGGLPDLSGLTSLYTLDVSYNFLSGEIPVSITNLAAASATSSQQAPGFHADPNHSDEFALANEGLSAQSGGLHNLYLSCGLTSSDPVVIAYMNNLNPRWTDNLCITTITADTPDPSRLGEEVTVSAMVGGGKYTREGSVHISGAETECDMTLSNGAGSCKVIFNTSGAKTLTATYEASLNLQFNTPAKSGISINSLEGSQDNEAHIVWVQRSLNGWFNTYTGTSKIPKYWSAVNFAGTDGKDISIKKEGPASVKITGTGTTKTLTQTRLLSGTAGDAFNLSYWVKGSSLPSAGVCQVQVKLYNGAAPAGTQTVNCPAAASFNWKKMTGNFTATSDYTKIVIKITFKKTSGTVWFDWLTLLK